MLPWNRRRYDLPSGLPGTALLLLRRMGRLSGGPSAAIDRLLAIGLMLLWAAIIAAGRWIAYS